VAKAALTKGRILEAAKNLFQIDGFEFVTIEKIAKEADVSAPTIYSLFQSKRGVLRALMDEVLPTEQFLALVEKGKGEKSAQKRLAISAQIARQIYDAEKSQMDLFRGAAMLAPEFKELEEERERRRYTRQESTIVRMGEEGVLAKGLTVDKARDILWAFTGRDLYRMFVVEKGWSSDEYEEWLAQTLIKNIIE